MESNELSGEIMTKLKSLKLLDNLESHVQNSIGIIIEETIDHNIAKARPRKINLNPTIHFDRCELDVKGGTSNGRKSKYKFHLMDVGDVLRVDDKHQLWVHQALNYFISRYKPTWGYVKSKDEYTSEVSFKRVK